MSRNMTHLWKRKLKYGKSEQPEKIKCKENRKQTVYLH